ncbi:DUF4168 domain-containing protein [Parapedobacter pyrenivorans]|uniref:DUF4168 domain-containing protein n=1 Tax=Parapedobacter pyrenivorans TaxID=1305674 RepID=UPI003341F227
MVTISKAKKTYSTIYGAVALILAMVGTSAVIAQEQGPVQPQQEIRQDFQKKELDYFLNANLKINEIQMEAQSEMMKVIEKEGISVEKFNEIASAQQNPDSTAVKPDPKEVESFQKAAEKITGMQPAIEERMVKAVEAEGLDVETYQQIAQAYQQSPKVKGELDQLIKEKQAQRADTLDQP